MSDNQELIERKAKAFDWLMKCHYAEIVNTEGGQTHLEIDGLITCRDDLLIAVEEAMRHKALDELTAFSQAIGMEY